MKRVLFLLFSFFAILPPSSALAQADSFSGIVSEVDGELIKVEGPANESFEAFFPYTTLSNSLSPKPGDRVILQSNESPQEGTPPYVISDFDRRRPLLILGILFILVTILITRIWGLRSFFGLFYSFFILFRLLLPQLLAGQDPVGISIVAALLIVPVTFYLSHGFNAKTNSAIIGTFCALVVTGLLAVLFVSQASLTGLSSEEAGFLLAFMGESLNTRGLLLAGIIIGTLGVLDDVTISQASVVYELRAANPKLSGKELFVRAMRVGHDHISSMVNTLVLVYTGASLPLLLLFLDSSQSLSLALNHEIFAEEIVRTLVGSIGLMLAVPFTTLVATLNRAR